MQVRHFTFTVRKRDSGPYHCAKIDAGGHHVEVVESPTGKSVHVYVDGKRVGP